MKKALIAGAASLAMAAMPVVGVFAVDQTDTLKVTIDSSCSVKNITHDNGSDEVGKWSGDTLSGTLSAGAYDNNFGSTSMTVVCNNSAGWQVTATTSDLVNAKNDKISPVANLSAGTTGYNWTVSQDDGTGLTIPTGAQGAAAEDSVASYNKPTDGNGKTFTVTYGISLANDVAAGTYSGTVAYTLNQL
ncbi:MAG: hypothetical protein Q4B65_02120 [Candidatus Saccharibacteria bacterium]|nr:hypothetical protein [Candidatus Saccharibacteria bacterium]